MACTTTTRRRNPDAKRFERLTYIEALNMRVGVMDSTALSLCMDNDLPIIVLDLWQPEQPGTGRPGRTGRHTDQRMTDAIQSSISQQLADPTLIGRSVS